MKKQHHSKTVKASENKTAKKKSAPRKTVPQKKTKTRVNNPENKKNVEIEQVQPVQSENSNFSIISEFDIYLFREGKHFSLYEKLGAHPVKMLGQEGIFFAVWAPNAEQVSVIGDFNHWNPAQHPLKIRNDDSGIWEGFIPGLPKGTVYKYHIRSRFNNYEVEKADPFAFYAEVPPKTASVVWDHNYTWKDQSWIKKRREVNLLEQPVSVYELHIESWKLVPEEGNRYLTYREMAHELAEYVNEMGYTHVELLPVTEYPFSGSWGYQVLGYFAPTSRFGNPQDFMYFVDIMHQHHIGVIMDWVPSHFPGDKHGLHFFDGTYLYEHKDPQQGYHPDWNSYIFNYGRNEIKEFLISSAHMWFDRFHIDGIRVDAVASMLYLDYSRKDGEWIPNEHGGRENLSAIAFLRDFNESVYEKFPGIQTIAEESTAWPMVTRPAYTGGLGFGMKWNMGWMHDTLHYFSHDPIYRGYHHNEITFSIWYAFNENFMLAISHDEVVHGKKSLINKMPGDDWQKFANLRLLFGYMFTHPGKKLNFMGNEIGQWNEWNYQQSIDWHLLDYETHKGLQRWVKELNQIYQKYEPLYQLDFHKDGFHWIDANDSNNNILSYIRFNKDKSKMIIAVCNFTPLPRYNYRIGVPEQGRWMEILNSDAKEYGGSGQGNFGGVDAYPVPYHNHDFSININLPPLGIVIFSV